MLRLETLQIAAALALALAAALLSGNATLSRRPAADTATESIKYTADGWRAAN